MQAKRLSILLFVVVSLMVATFVIAEIKNGFEIKRVRASSDLAPPETTCTLNPPSPDGINGWYISPVTITLNAYDESGVDKTYCSIDGGIWHEYATPLVISTDGWHSVAYYSVDIYGNAEDTKYTSFSIDQTHPISTIIHISPSGYWQINEVQLFATASDSCSGISTVSLWYRYSEDNTSWGEWTLFKNDSFAPYEFYFDFTWGYGFYEFFTIATDNAGNLEDKTEVEARVGVSSRSFAWVDDDFNPFTPGWGYDHFNEIQKAIRSVAEGGQYTFPVGFTMRIL